MINIGGGNEDDKLEYIILDRIYQFSLRALRLCVKNFVADRISYESETQNHGAASQMLAQRNLMGEAQPHLLSCPRYRLGKSGYQQFELIF